MKEEHRNKSRGPYHKNSTVSGHIHKLILPFLGNLLSMLPAFFYSCSSAPDYTEAPSQVLSTKITLNGTAEGIKTLDIFVFKDDILRKLDCYQRFEDMDKWQGTVVSGSGERVIAILANSPYGRERWLPMSSMSYLKDIHVSLEDETRDYPFMIGEVPIDTSQKDIHDTNELNLKPLAGEVRLNSICCDFSGKAYAGERLSDVRVYLTNVNAECAIYGDGSQKPIRIINAGRFRKEDADGFMDPGLIIRNLAGEIGTVSVYPDISFRCYPGSHPKETPGTPFTRLVIEGKISGHTYYWPININRETDDMPGIWSGCSYSYDIIITRKGSSDPDIPVEAADLIIKQEVKEWKDMKEYEVRF